MKISVLAKAIGGIDDDLVEDAILYKREKKTRKRRVIAFSAAAAVICLVVVGTLLLSGQLISPAPEEPESIVWDSPGASQGAINATVEEIYEDYVVAKCFESLSGPISSGDRVKVSKHNISSVPVPEMSINDSIRVLYFGEVSEEDALLVPDTIISIFLLEDEDEAPH